MTRLLVILSLLCLAFVPAAARAQTVQTTAAYAAGWNMAGGPTGTIFSSASSLDAWQNGAYTDASGRVATACTGYWAFFVNPAVLPLPLSTGPTQSCPLQPGWNLVGNPFSGIANLPFGTSGYEWRPLAGSYAIVNSIDPGHAVWIYSSQAGSVNLTYAPAPASNPPVTLTINAQGGPGPYQIHVGDSVKVYANGITPPTVTADSAHFALESSGVQYDLSCTNAACQTNPTGEFWIFGAISTGSGTITVTPTCVGQEVACIGDSIAIQFTILP